MDLRDPIGFVTTWRSGGSRRCPREQEYMAERDEARLCSKKNQRVWRVVFASLFFLIIALSILWTRPLAVYASQSASGRLIRRSSISPLLDVFQVTTPVVVPANATCRTVIMEYSFANSYGAPFVGSYNPPPCDFNHITLNLTVTAAGRQFDRLAIMYFNDTEIWRTSTAEPTQNGIIWTYTKDVSNYLSLFKEPQKLIFDLGNIVDNTYTAPFNTTLTATFFNAPEETAPADLILPISARSASTNRPSAFQVPQMNASSSFAIPRNAKRAVFTVSACGQINEEFWWSNVLSSDSHTFGSNTPLGFSPFREVQVLIDGQLAGVSWPFPVIFTGGIVPGFWRPVVGIDAFDLKEDEIDVSPWLSVLSDGKDHAYEIRVVGITDDGKGNGEFTTVGSYWVVTGKLFLWLDNDSSSVTTGTPVKRIAPQPSLSLMSQVGSTSNGTNTTLDYHVTAQRYLSFSSLLTTSEGTVPVSWTQTLSYSNTGNVSAEGMNQTNTQTTTGLETSSFGYSRTFSYPLTVSDAADVDTATNAFTIAGTIDRGKSVQVIGPSVFPSGLETFPGGGSSSEFEGSSVVTRQNGTAFLQQSPADNISISRGSTEQDYTFSGLEATLPNENSSQELYSRHVLAVNGGVVEDSNPGGITQMLLEQTSDQQPISPAESEFAIPAKPGRLLGRQIPWYVTP